MNKPVMFITFLSFAVFFLALPSFLPTSAATVIFNRNLKVGDSGSDVLVLQKILNSNQATQIAVSGSGSPGNETAFFGLLTKNAVIKFQNLYANDILAPNGLTVGTGYVGATTRAKLTSLLNTSTSSSSVSSVATTTITTTVVLPNAPLIKTLSGVKFSPGDMVTVTGLNFSSSSVLYLSQGSDQISTTSYKIISSSTLQFVVPQYAGVLEVWVKDGIHDSRLFTPVYIVIVDNSSGSTPNDIDAIVSTVLKQNQRVMNSF
jgi:peptidoglycan hydrolase-like protein with peptidoglycan-binding domain